MSARPKPARGIADGNFVAEWFGHRVWPTVSGTAEALKDQCARSCPFLTVATGQPTLCTKTSAKDDWAGEPYGVCTVSSDSNGRRQDWICCPYRTLDQHFTLLSSAVRSCYHVPDATDIVLLPVTVLHRSEQRERMAAGLRTGSRVFVFSAVKLGGEIDLPETDASPGAAVDMSVIEVLGLDPASGQPKDFGQHMFYEIQTADFHGSPLHAAGALRALCPRDNGAEFHARLSEAIEVCGTGMEGPNKANIFKRTIYQMIFKIELVRHADCAGFAIVLPVPVWDSWLRHLGQPALVQVGTDGKTAALLAEGEDAANITATSKSSVYIFDIDRTSSESPQPLKIIHRVLASAAALQHFAFDVAAEEAIKRNVVPSFRSSFIDRVGRGWADKLAPKEKTERSKGRKRKPAAGPTHGDTTTTVTASGPVESDTEENG